MIHKAITLAKPGDVLAKAKETVAKEEGMRARLRNGEYIYDILKLGDALKALGVAEQ